jgi:hypothetical protein
MQEQLGGAGGATPSYITKVHADGQAAMLMLRGSSAPSNMIKLVAIL